MQHATYVHLLKLIINHKVKLTIQWTSSQSDNEDVGISNKAVLL
jgi:hypothetical protein